MAKSHPLDPYAGNILIQGLGPILSRQDALAALTFLPSITPERYWERTEAHQDASTANTA